MTRVFKSNLRVVHRDTARIRRFFESKRPLPPVSMARVYKQLDRLPSSNDRFQRPPRPILEEEINNQEKRHAIPDEEKCSEAQDAIDGFIGDPFSPFDGLPDENEKILTFRALAVGVACGGLVNASNIYLGLKSGWTQSANLFASILGFALLKRCPGFLEGLSFLNADFGPRENNIVQTAATAAGGMSSVFNSAFPAMYQLGLLESPTKDFWRLVTLTAVGGCFGLFFAAPLRKFFIVDVARDLNIVFPTPSATAVTIRNMHQAADSGSPLERQKTKVLMIAFGLAATLRIMSQYATGLFWDWHIFTWYLWLSPTSSTAVALESWGWFLEWTPAFIGTGMLVGLNTAASFFAGSLLAWGIIGPILVSQGLAFAAEDNDTGLVSYYTMSEDFVSASHPSPRYWLLWPAVACIIAVTLTQLACQWRVFWISIKAVSASLYRIAASPFLMSSVRDQKSRRSQVMSVSMPLRDSVSTFIVVPGLLLAIALACTVMKLQYSIPPLETLLALFLAFLLALVAIIATGVTDITPLTPASASSQVILGADASSKNWSTANAERLSLLAGALSAMGASQAVDLMGDFRVGFLLRTPVQQQWLAQLIGTLFASIIAPGTYVLFNSAYSCINDITDTKCPFQAPAASAWRAIAMVATDPASGIPPSSLTFSAIMVLVGILSVLTSNFVWVEQRRWLRQYQPNFMVLSMAFILPSTVYGTAMLMGAFLASHWLKESPSSFHKYAYAIAAGMISGEGIGGVINAGIQIIGLSGDVFGTGIGCPSRVC